METSTQEKKSFQLKAKKNISFSRESGASAIEYALLIACLVLVLVTALSGFGTKISESMTDLVGKIQGRISANTDS